MLRGGLSVFSLPDDFTLWIWHKADGRLDSSLANFP